MRCSPFPPVTPKTNIASEPDYIGNPDMITQNETGPEAGRYIFQTHELGLNTNTGVSVTDLVTGTTKMLVQRNDWGSLDGIAWTPWGTLLVAEERSAGKVWELDPQTLALNPRPALGLKSHEGMRFDHRATSTASARPTRASSISFIPDTRGDLSSGQLYALKIVNPTGDRVGEAEWIPLDRTAVQVDANAAALAAGATGYNRPEDVEIATSTGNNRGGANVLYVASTGPSNPVDNRVIAIDSASPKAAGTRHGVRVRLREVGRERGPGRIRDAGQPGTRSQRQPVHHRGSGDRASTPSAATTSGSRRRQRARRTRPRRAWCDSRHSRTAARSQRASTST